MDVRKIIVISMVFGYFFVGAMENSQPKRRKLSLQEIEDLMLRNCPQISAPNPRALQQEIEFLKGIRDYSSDLSSDLKSNSLKPQVTAQDNSDPFCLSHYPAIKVLLENQYPMKN